MTSLQGEVLTGNTSDRTEGGATMVGWLLAMVPGKVCTPSNTGLVSESDSETNTVLK